MSDYSSTKLILFLLLATFDRKNICLFDCFSSFFSPIFFPPFSSPSLFMLSLFPHFFFNFSGFFYNTSFRISLSFFLFRNLCEASGFYLLVRFQMARHGCKTKPEGSVKINCLEIDIFSSPSPSLSLYFFQSSLRAPSLSLSLPIKMNERFAMLLLCLLKNILKGGRKIFCWFFA